MSVADRRPALPSAAALALVLLVLAVCAHGLLLWAPFVYDDAAFLADDALITGPWPGLWAFLTRTFGGGEYEPVGRLFHWGLYHLFGATPWPYRATSLLLHWANVCLFLRLARKRLGDGAGLAAAALFAAFPGNVEALALTTFKKHLFVSLFVLTGLDIYDIEGPRPFAKAVQGAVLSMLAVLSKESGLIFVPLIAVHAWSVRGRLTKRDYPFLVGASLSSAVYVAVRLSVLPRTSMPLAGGSLPAHLATSAKILLWHLGQLAVPVDLGIEHGLRPVSGAAEGAFAVIGASCWLAAGLYAVRRDKVAASGWAWTSLALAPFLNIVPFLNFSLVANRYEYLASAGFLLMVGRVAETSLRPKHLLFIAAVPFVLFTGLSARYAALFSSPYALWSDAVARAPENARAHAGLGQVLAGAHADAAAERELRRAVELAPGLPDSYPALSWLAAQSGRSDEALALANARLALRRDSTGWANLGMLLMRAGRYGEALPALARAAELVPGAQASLGLGQCLLALGSLDQAEAELSAAAADPDARAKALRGLGELALKRGRRDEARRLLAESLRADPLQLEVAAELARLLPKEQGAALFDDILARLNAIARGVTAETPELEAGERAYVVARIAEAEKARLKAR